VPTGVRLPRLLRGPLPHRAGEGLGELRESDNDGYPRVGGDSVSSRSSSSGGAVDDGRDTALDKTDTCSQTPPEERTLDVSRGFSFGYRAPSPKDPFPKIAVYEVEVLVEFKHPRAAKEIGTFVHHFLIRHVPPAVLG
jgi:hypothetical protein